MFKNVLSQMLQRFAELPDERKGGHTKRFSMADAALSAFSVFMMQSASSGPSTRHEATQRAR